VHISRDVKQLEDILNSYLENPKKNPLHYSELSKIFKRLRRLDREIYLDYVEKLPAEPLGDLLLTLTEGQLKEVLDTININKIIKGIESLESDDATDVMQDIEEIDEELAKTIMEKMDYREKEEIKLLRRYDDDQAGAYMQTELFTASHTEKISDTIERLRVLKKKKELENINTLYITGDYNNLVASINLEDLILLDFNKTFREILLKTPEKYKPRYIRDEDEIEDVAKLFKEYDLTTMPVVDNHGLLIGRITSDDIYDILQEMATEQIYNLAGVDDEAESQKRVFEIARTRATWLTGSLFAGLVSATVIGKFQTTIGNLPILAALMPIVAAMGGNTGNQALTVTVRQLATGEIDHSNWTPNFLREIMIAVLNGLMFAVIVGTIIFLWKGDLRVALVIAAAMVVNLITAGLCGGLIPMVLKKLNVDPAVGSSVVLTTITDVVGFFIFLTLATLFVLKN
jgi:magnesium transporter